MAAYSSTDDATFGVLCGEQCSFYIALPYECGEGTRIPALINSSAGANPATLTCFALEEGVTVGLVREDLTRLAESGGMIGVAIPLRDSTFVAHSFSLNGFLPALRSIMPIAEGLRAREEARELPTY